MVVQRILGALLLLFSVYTFAQKTPVGADLDNAKNRISDGTKPLIILNKKEIKYEKMNEISNDSIKQISVLKPEIAVKEYGDRGKYGVIIITTREGVNIPEQIFK